jgi:hypothetical protein
MNKTHEAAVNLLKYMAARYGVKNASGFWCPHMRALAETIPVKEWVVKTDAKYKKLEKEAELCEQAFPKFYFFEAISADTGDLASWTTPFKGTAIFLCEKWDYDTPRAFVNGITNEFSYFRMPWPSIIGDEAHFEAGVIYMADDEEYKYKAPTVDEVRKAMKKEGFEEKIGLAKVYAQVSKKIINEKRYGTKL